MFSLQNCAVQAIYIKGYDFQSLFLTLYLNSPES